MPNMLKYYFVTHMDALTPNVNTHPASEEKSLTRLEQLLKMYNKYTNNPDYVYKLISRPLLIDKYLIVMRKLEDTKTNEAIKVIDSDHAKFRANKLIVISIINIFDFSDTPNKIINRHFIKRNYVDLTYVVGKIVIPDGFDDNIDVICTKGVHYFRTLETAYYYYRHECKRLENDVQIQWDDDGRIVRTQYRDENGDLIMKYWAHSTPTVQNNTKNTSRVSNSHKYYKNTQYNEHCIYHDNGVMSSRTHYGKFREKDGLFEEWFENGDRSQIVQYKNNKKVGMHQFWERDGNLYYESLIHNNQPIGIIKKSGSFEQLRGTDGKKIKLPI